MARDEAVTCITLEAGADLSTKQYFFVSMSSDGQVDPTGDGASAIGVLQNDPAAAGRAAEVAIGGRTMVSAGGTIAAGAAVASDAAGEAVTAATGDVILGTALEGASDGDICAILFQPRGAA
jgi:hypothetical protein